MNFQIGHKIYTWDYDDNRWTLSKVLEFDGESIKLEDIDPQSNWQGMIWEDEIDELKWKKL